MIGITSCQIISFICFQFLANRRITFAKSLIAGKHYRRIWVEQTQSQKETVDSTLMVAKSSEHYTLMIKCARLGRSTYGNSSIKSLACILQITFNRRQVFKASTKIE